MSRAEANRRYAERKLEMDRIMHGDAKITDAMAQSGAHELANFLHGSQGFEDGARRVYAAMHVARFDTNATVESRIEKHRALLGRLAEEPSDDRE